MKSQQQTPAAPSHRFDLDGVPEILGTFALLGSMLAVLLAMI